MGLGSSNCTRVEGRGGSPRHGRLCARRQGSGRRAVRPYPGGGRSAGLRYRPPQTRLGPMCFLGTTGPYGRRRHIEVGFGGGCIPKTEGGTPSGNPEGVETVLGQQEQDLELSSRCAGAVDPLMTENPGQKTGNASHTSPARHAPSRFASLEPHQDQKPQEHSHPHRASSRCSPRRRPQRRLHIKRHQTRR